jgi:ketosteroid isomerase-like protein
MYNHFSRHLPIVQLRKATAKFESGEWSYLGQNSAKRSFHYKMAFEENIAIRDQREKDMKKVIFVLGLFLFTSIAGTVNSGIDSEFKPLIANYYAAWNTMKAENAAQFYAKDADRVFYDITPLQYKSWTEYQVGAQKNFFDTTTSCKLIPNDDLKVTRHGNVAWTTLTFHLSAQFKDGNKAELDARQTSIWQKLSGKWLIVHEHISVPLGGGQAEKHSK